MKFFKSIQVVMFALATLLLVSCNENDVITPGADAPNAPSALMAQSQDGAVKLKWTISTTGATPTGFRIMYRTLPTGTLQSVNVTGGTSTSASVPGLTNGTIYQFMVHAVNDTAVSAASNTIDWAPAKRTTTALRLHSSMNTTDGSGLNIWNTTNSPASVQKIATGDMWDICFDDKTDASDPRIASPGQTQYVDGSFQFPNGKDARITYWGSQLMDIASLDDVFESAALTVPGAGSEKFYQINSITGTKNWGSVIASKNDDGSYNIGKVMMVRTGGKFVQGTGADSYIDVQLSYQTMKNVPHALKMAIDAAQQTTRVNHTAVK